MMKTYINSTSIGKDENTMKKEIQLYWSGGTRFKDVLQITIRYV